MALRASLPLSVALRASLDPPRPVLSPAMSNYAWRNIAALALVAIGFLLGVIAAGLAG